MAVLRAQLAAAEARADAAEAMWSRLKDNLVFCEVALGSCCRAVAVDEDGDLPTRCARAADAYRRMSEAYLSDQAMIAAGRRCVEEHHDARISGLVKACNELEEQRESNAELGRANAAEAQLQKARADTAEALLILRAQTPKDLFHE